MEKLGVTVSLTFGYHPESNGQAERMNQEIGRFLRSFSSDNQSDWAKYILTQFLNGLSITQK